MRTLLLFLGVCRLRFEVLLGVILRLPGYVSCAAPATLAKDTAFSGGSARCEPFSIPLEVVVESGAVAVSP